MKFFRAHPFLAHGEPTSDAVFYPVKNALEHAVRALPPFLASQAQRNVHFYIQEQPCPPNFPVGGRTFLYDPPATDGACCGIVIFSDPRHPPLSDFWHPVWRRTLIHELHHALRLREKKEKAFETLGDCLVSEGLAVHAESLVGTPGPYAAHLTPRELERAAAKALPLLDTPWRGPPPLFDYGAWFFGKDDFSTPLRPQGKGSAFLKCWSGYSLGAAVVSAWLATKPFYQGHPVQTAFDAVSVPAQVLLAPFRTGKLDLLAAYPDNPCEQRRSKASFFALRADPKPVRAWPHAPMF